MKKMKDYKRIAYAVATIAALGGGIQTYNISSEMENLRNVRNTPAVQQIRDLKSDIHQNCRNPFSGDLQEIASKYSKLDELLKNKEYAKELEEYDEAAFGTQYAGIAGILFGASLVLAGLASGRVRIGK